MMLYECDGCGLVEEKDDGIYAPSRPGESPPLTDCDCGGKMSYIPGRLEGDYIVEED